MNKRIIAMMLAVMMIVTSGCSSQMAVDKDGNVSVDGVPVGNLYDKGSLSGEQDKESGSDDENTQDDVLSDLPTKWDLTDLFADEDAFEADMKRVEALIPKIESFRGTLNSAEGIQKMLEDPHLKVLHYEQDAKKIFSNTDIKGGVAITYRSREKNFGAIGTFTPYEELNDIMRKVKNDPGFMSMSTIVVTRTAYRLTDKLHKDYPEAASQLSDGHMYDMSTNIFDRLPQVFFSSKPQDHHQYIQILGRENNERVYKYIRKDYVNDVINLFSYKLLLPKATGTGAFGESFAEPIICGPGIGSTETFISIGDFEDKREAETLLKYVKSKFARGMLGILKTTQDITPEKWLYVPLQDFSANSDINWNTSIANIDKQLYKKYGLTAEEIQFIETNVKEMV